MRYPETAALIRSARRRNGLSQERVAAQIGCSRLQVIRWEQGLHKPNPDGHGQALADLLGIDDGRLANADEEDDEEAAVGPLARDLAAALHAEAARVADERVSALAERVAELEAVLRS